MDRLEENNIVEEVKKSFLDYSMSVIVARALPDLRDGLKPVHRRILYSMYETGYTPDKPYKKCAKTVGEVMGNYHPHGDSSIYEAMVRMAQDFSYRYMLVDGHGNFGNMDGDGAAAMRYTEARLSKISLELLRDLNKNTVDFVPNFDEEKNEPAVLPSRFPNILVNGTMGIAVGMATNIPPHNLREVVNGCIAYIDNNDITLDELMTYIKGPDFPTGAIILGNSGIRKAYETGRGTITVRCKAAIEETGHRSRIVISEVPYGLNTMDLKNRIASLVRDKVLEGIADYHEETGNDFGVKIVITLKKDANANVVLNNLYKHTQLQNTFGIILLMLDQGVPKLLGLKDIIVKYIDHQKEVIIRRTKFDLDKALAKAHILEGYKIALDHLDDFIKIIRESESDVIAKERLKNLYSISDAQADAILELKLRRLTGLERDKIERDLADTLKLIDELRDILGSSERVNDIIKTEMKEIADKYGDERRTSIDMTAIDYIEDESLIPNDDVIVSMTKNGYIKRLVSDTYRSQNRGGVGIKGMATNDEDIVEKLINCESHDYLLFFSNRGKVYRIKCYELPEFSRQSKGVPIVNILPLEKGEVINAIIPVKKEDDSKYLIFFTVNGLVKRTDIAEFDSIRKNGKIAINLKDNDELIGVKKTSGNDEVIIASNSGRMVRFNETDVRVMGRGASGVKGIELIDSKVIGAEVVNNSELILVVTEKGYGKKTDVNEYRLTHRGSKGVKALNITDKNGLIVAFKSVVGDEDIVITTDEGTVIRLDVNNVSTLRRNTQGVRLMNLKDKQFVTSVTVLAKQEVEDENISNVEENVS